MRRASRAVRWSWVSLRCTREACGTPCLPTRTTVAWRLTSISTSLRRRGSSTSWGSQPRPGTSLSATRRLSSPLAGLSTQASAQQATASSGRWPVRTSRSTTWTASPSQKCVDAPEKTEPHQRHKLFSEPHERHNRLRTMAIQKAPRHSSDDDVPSAAGARASAGAGAGASEKTLLVLEAALTHSRITEVVDSTGLAKATTHRILSTLVDRQFVAVDADGNYLPGPKILSLAGMALQRIDISAIAQPFIDELVAKSHCTVHLGVVNGDEIIYLARADSDKPYVMPSRVGLAVPMHSTGIGKVVLSSYTDDELERFVARAGLRPRTEHTITTLEGLKAEI